MVNAGEFLYLPHGIFLVRERTLFRDRQRDSKSFFSGQLSIILKIVLYFLSYANFR
jgi:hypothetical protein